MLNPSAAARRPAVALALSALLFLTACSGPAADADLTCAEDTAFQVGFEPETLLPPTSADDPAVASAEAEVCEPEAAPQATHALEKPEAPLWQQLVVLAIAITFFTLTGSAPRF